MTHKEILEQTKAELDRLVSEVKQKLDELATPKLEVGKWYKDTEESSELLVYITDIRSNEIVGYGFGLWGEWASNTYFYSGNMDNAYRFLVEATEQEVEAALVKEAKRRGFVNGTIVNNSNVHDSILKSTKLFFNNEFIFSKRENTLSAVIDDETTWAVFKDGKWAEVIEQPVDKFAELKEAYRNGAVIQYKSKANGQWYDNTTEPSWYDDYEYRIKPEEKPKVGDVCKFWGDDENEFVISKIRKVYYGGFYTLFYTLEEIPYYNAKKLTKQEVIDMLFGSED